MCHKYWPTRGIESYGEYDISLLEQTMHNSYLERIYSITDSKVQIMPKLRALAYSGSL